MGNVGNTSHTKRDLNLQIQLESIETDFFPELESMNKIRKKIKEKDQDGRGVRCGTHLLPQRHKKKKIRVPINEWLSD